MDKNITIEPLTNCTIDAYISVGRKSYLQHYVHLWEDSDCSYYLAKNFTKTALKNEMKDNDSELFLVHYQKTVVGVLKLQKNTALKRFKKTETLLLDKIYLLKEHSGKGIGKAVLDFVMSYANNQHKKVVWLVAMCSSSALDFYLKNEFKILDKGILKYPNLKPSESSMYILTKTI